MGIGSRIAFTLTATLLLTASAWILFSSNFDSGDRPPLVAIPTAWGSRPLETGTRLRVPYTGGACDIGEDTIDIAETAKTVTLTIQRYVMPNTICTFQGIPRVIYAILHDPLVARHLVDGACAAPQDASEGPAC